MAQMQLEPALRKHRVDVRHNASYESVTHLMLQQYPYTLKETRVWVYWHKRHGVVDELFCKTKQSTPLIRHCGKCWRSSLLDWDGNSALCSFSRHISRKAQIWMKSGLLPLHVAILCSSSSSMWTCKTWSRRLQPKRRKADCVRVREAFASGALFVWQIAQLYSNTDTRVKLWDDDGEELWAMEKDAAWSSSEKKCGTWTWQRNGTNRWQQWYNWTAVCPVTKSKNTKGINAPKLLTIYKRLDARTCIARDMHRVTEDLTNWSKNHFNGKRIKTTKCRHALLSTKDTLRQAATTDHVFLLPKYPW